MENNEDLIGRLFECRGSILKYLGFKDPIEVFHLVKGPQQWESEDDLTIPFSGRGIPETFKLIEDENAE